MIAHYFTASESITIRMFTGIYETQKQAMVEMVCETNAKPSYGAKVMLLVKVDCFSKEEQCSALNLPFFAWKFSNHSMAHQEGLHLLDGLP